MKETKRQFPPQLLSSGHVRMLNVQTSGLFFPCLIIRSVLQHLYFDEIVVLNNHGVSTQYSLAFHLVFNYLQLHIPIYITFIIYFYLEQAPSVPIVDSFSKLFFPLGINSILIQILQNQMNPFSFMRIG